MPSNERRNPASSRALTVFEVRELPIGTTLLVCTMNDYPVNRKLGDPLVRRVDGFTPVIFRGTIPRPEAHFDTGTGSWVVFDQKLGFGMHAMTEVRRRWGRASRYAYEPSVLGLTLAVNPSPGSRRPPTWNDYTCVIRPEHEQELRSEYPRRVRSY